MQHGWELGGLVINTVGVLVLFRFGMPFRVETRGHEAVTLEGEDGQAIAVERKYKILGWSGITMIVVGAGMQAIGLLSG